MMYLALGAGVLFLVLWGAGAKRFIKRPEWRIGAAVFAAAAFAATAYLGLRQQWIPAVVMLILGLWLATSARYPRATTARPAPVSMEMSIAEAYDILDLKPGATREDVQAAYTRLMKLVHPDRGGGAGLAAKLNAARDKLLKH